MADQTTLPNPFTADGAARISSLAGQAVAPTQPIDASVLSAPASVNIPQTAPVPAPHPSSIVLPTIQNTPEQDALNTQKDSLISSIEADTAKLGTKSAEQTRLEGEQGIPQLNKDIQELYDQANQIDASSVQAKANSEDRLAPMFAISGEQAQIDRQAAAKKAGIGAILSAKQGKLSLAQDYVTKALAAEFDPITAEIDNKKFLLQINSDNFNTEEKRRAEAASAALDQQKQALQDQKDAKNQVYSIMLDAAKNGADNVTLSKIQSAATPEAAIAAAGQFTSDPLARQQEALNLQKTQEDIKLTDANIQKALADAYKARQGTSSGIAGLSQEALDQQAQNYLITGKLSALGNGGAAAKLAILNRAAEMASGPGGVPAAAAKYAAAANAVKTRTDSLTKLLSSSSNLEAQFSRLGELADKVNTGSIPALNALNAKFKRGIGNDDAASYLELINTIRSDYSNMQAAVAGSKGAEYFNSQAAHAIPDGLTSSQYASIYQTLQQSSANAQTAIQNEINSVLDSATTPGSSSGISVTDPTGAVHTFPDQQSADAFKKAAGIK